jgi:hypothetical protein
MPSMPSVPLISARPSFAASSSGSSPAECRASAADMRAPSLPSTQPSPSSTSAQWASGARSPDAPSDPCSGTHGVMPAFSRSTRPRASIGRTPDNPRASDRTRSSIIARTTSRGIGSPTPAACERISACCNSARRSGAMNVFASAPNPVDTPYTGRPDASMRSTIARLAAIASIVASASRTLASRRATARTSAAVTPLGWTTTLMRALHCAGRF